MADRISSLGLTPLDKARLRALASQPSSSSSSSSSSSFSFASSSSSSKDNPSHDAMPIEDPPRSSSKRKGDSSRWHSDGDDNEEKEADQDSNRPNGISDNGATSEGEEGGATATPPS